MANSDSFSTEIETVARTIVEKFNPEKIILFGSRAWGGAHQDSDIDLLVVKESKLPRIERDNWFLYCFLTPNPSMS